MNMFHSIGIYVAYTAKCTVANSDTVEQWSQVDPLEFRFRMFRQSWRRMFLDLQKYQQKLSCWNFERKSAQTVRKSCKHARLAHLDQTFRNQVAQELLVVI